jgi:hypothetical protein
MELENDTVSSPALSGAWLSVGNRNPGALPQARDECCAFGAKYVQRNSIGSVVGNAMLTFDQRN